MRRLIALLLVCIPMVSFATGCGPRAQLAKEKLLDRVDSLLGSIEVKRAEVEQSVEGLRESLTQLRAAKIRAEVQHEQLEQRCVSTAEEISRLDRSLRRLREHLTSGGPVVLAGKEISQHELQTMGHRVLAVRASHVRQLESLQQSSRAIKQIVSTLEERQSQFENRLAALDMMIVEIDSKTTALRALQDASSAVGHNGDDLEESVRLIEQKMADLFVEVETELRVEQLHWSESANPQFRSVEDLLSSIEESSQTVAEIDKISAD